MPSLPVPIVGTLVLGFLFAALVLRRDRHWLLAVLVGVCALQGLIIGLGQHYGVGVIRAVQPITASFMPPLAWVAFQLSAVRTLGYARHARHLAGPVLTLLYALYVPGALDLLIPLMFLGYGAALLLAVRSGTDGMPGTRLDSGNIPARIWGVIAIILLASAFFDGAVALALMAGVPHWQPWIVSGGFAGMLLMLGVVALSGSLTKGRRGEIATGVKGTSVNEADPGVDAAIMARLNALLADQELYLDPDLTLGRLSRRLGIPVKQLSAAINRRTGGNVSRYVNGFRIERACAGLRAGESVTTAMLSSGFNTRSNFNREFRRITGKSPSDWRAAGRDR